MEKKLPLKLFLFISLIAPGCASCGYRGPLYYWTKEDIVYYNAKTNSVCFKETSRQVFYVEILWDRKKYFQQKDIRADQNCFTLPDSISQEIRNSRAQITVFCKNNTNAYIIDFEKSDWHNKNYIYGFPLNDVTNDKEMYAEIHKLDKETNRK